jgi:hypothetical protein
MYKKACMPYWTYAIAPHLARQMSGNIHDKRDLAARHDKMSRRHCAKEKKRAHLAHAAAFLFHVRITRRSAVDTARRRQFLPAC